MEMLARHRPGDGRLHAELRRPLAGAARSCRAGSRTCWSTAPPASRSAWRPTSRRTTCVEVGAAVQWALEQPDCHRRGAARGVRRADPRAGLPDRRADRRPRRHRPGAAHRPRLGPDARGRRGRGGLPRPRSSSSSPSCPTRSTRTRSPRRSPTWSATARSPASPTSRTTPAVVPVSGWSSCSSATRSRRSCSTTSTSTPSCRTRFGVNMLALVDGVPRTLNIGQMVRYYVAHQVEIIVRRTQFRLRKAQERAHILIALLKAQDRIDEVIALIRGERVRRGRAHRADGAARDRRDAGDRDPRHAAAPARRAGAAAAAGRATTS